MVLLKHTANASSPLSLAPRIKLVFKRRKEERGVEKGIRKRTREKEKQHEKRMVCTRSEGVFVRREIDRNQRLPGVQLQRIDRGMCFINPVVY